MGGLTIRFNLTDPGTVIPVTSVLLMIYICVTAAEIALEMIAVQRRQWSLDSWFLYTMMDIAGRACSSL